MDVSVYQSEYPKRNKSKYIAESEKISTSVNIALFFFLFCSKQELLKKHKVLSQEHYSKMDALEEACQVFYKTDSIKVETKIYRIKCNVFVDPKLHADALFC